MIAASAGLDNAAGQVWDVLVVGAGPAGTLAARQVALAGLRVLLVDAKGFPRPKVCGGCLNGQALAILQSVGLAAVPEILGGNLLNQFDVRSRGRRLRLALPGGIAVSRFRLDEALVQSAMAAGAAFLPETSAFLGEICGNDRDEWRAVALHGRDGRQVEARARVMLAADGLAHLSLRNHPEFSSRVARGALIGVGSLVTEYPAAYVPGTVFMAVGRHGYAGMTCVEEGRLNLAAAVVPEFVKDSGGLPLAIAAILDEAGFPPILSMVDAEWQGTLPLTRRTKQTAGRRVLLLGDAAGYVEPFTGEGMAWAFAAAVAVAPFVERGLDTWTCALEHAWQRTLRRCVHGRQQWCRWLAFTLRHPLAIELAMRATSLAPSLAATIVRSLNRPPVPFPATRYENASTGTKPW